MSKILFSPEWFYGFESLFDFITIIAAFLIGLYAYKFYKLSKERNYKFFSLSFFAIALSYFVKLFTYTNVYLRYFISREQLGVVEGLVSNIPSLSTLALTVHQYLLLVGLLGILVILLKTRSKILIILLLYFITAITFLSLTAAYVIHITAALITFFIFMKYYVNYEKRKNRANMYVMLSFLALFVSQLFFLFKFRHAMPYVIGELFQIVGYAFLLYTFITITRK